MQAALVRVDRGRRSMNQPVDYDPVPLTFAEIAAAPPVRVGFIEAALSGVPVATLAGPM